MTYKLMFAAVLALLVFACPAATSKKAYVDLRQKNVAAFIDEMVAQHDFNRDALSTVLASAEIKPDIIQKISG